MSEREGRVQRAAKKRKKSSAGLVIGRILLVLLTTVLALAAAVLIIGFCIFKGPSPSARDMFTTTVLESGNLKFVASIFLSDEEIQSIVDKTSMETMETDIDDNLISVDEEAEGDFDENGIQICDINGRGYHATMMIVKDPSKVCVGSTYPWTEYGKTLDEIVSNYNAIGGVNGGLYAADKNKGGSPYGVCVSNGEIQYNNPSGWAGLYMIGFDSKNILRIVDIAGWSQTKFEQYVASEGIRDAVAFQDEVSDKNNHFVPLVINGEARELNGSGSGVNPRTAIGQRADGAVLLLVTDGRGSAGHLGASASDLIDIMLEYGAVNAANLDGGSSSCMYYEDEYLMTSVTLYYANSSWRLPTAFLVMGGEQ